MRGKLKLVFLLVPVIVFFFGSRLVNLTLIPVFCDEAIYIRWSQVMRAEPTLRFLPLSDGKQPLFMWLTIPFLKVFSDPLFASRLLSVLAGFLSLVGVFLLALRLFEVPKIALLSALFYAIIPYTFFFDRMALVDSLLSAFGIWVLYLGVLLVEYRRLDLAMITGMVLGGALITKSPAMFFAIMLPICLIIRLNEFRKSPLQLIKLGALFFVVYLFAFGIYNVLRLGPNFHMIAIRSRDYVFGIDELRSHLHDPIIFHLQDISKWFPDLFTRPVYVLIFVGIIWSFVNKERVGPLVLLSWSLIPLLTQSIFARVFTPRYLLFTTYPLVIFAAFGFYRLVRFLKAKLWVTGVFLIFLVSFSLWYDWLLMTDPQRAPLPRKMRSGYLEEWTSGYGIVQVANFIKNKAKEGKVAVGTEGFFGTLPDGLQIYLEKVPNVEIFGVGQPIREVPESLRERAEKMPTYLLVNDTRMFVQDDSLLTLMAKYPKAKGPKGQENLLLFQVK